MSVFDDAVMVRFETYYKVNPITGCWHWIGHLIKGGYGQFRVGGGEPRWLAHRVSYTQYKGEIPPDMTVDHLCWNTRCVNPDHMELVPLSINTSRMNAVRSTLLCCRGHPFDVIRYKAGVPYRACSVCGNRNPTPNFDELSAALWGKAA